MGKHTKKGNKAIYIILAVIAALLIGLIVAYQLLVKAPEVVDDGLANNDNTQQADSDAPETASDRKDGVYTFLVVGFDKVGNNTDTIMVGRLDTGAGSLSVISIPRDTLVNCSYNIKKVNTIYPAAVNNGKDGIQDLLEAVKGLVGFSIDSYAFIDLEACEKIVDIIGVVTFDVPCDMYYDDPTQDLHIAIPAGTQNLNGDNFVKVMRFRNTYAGGDIQRIGVQHDLLKALAKQTLTAGNIMNIDQLMNVYEQYVDTNLSQNNLYFYLTEFLKLDFDNIVFETLPHSAVMLCSLSYVMIDTDAWVEMINNYLDPYETAIAKANLDIITFNGKDFLSTSGEMKGGPTSFYNFNLGYTPEVILDR